MSGWTADADERLSVGGDGAFVDPRIGGEPITLDSFAFVVASTVGLAAIVRLERDPLR